MTSTKVLIWDLPTRTFHWLLALSFLGAYVTSDSERLRDVHILFGYSMLALVAFRLVWGLAGSRYARFSSFAYGPRAVARYVAAMVRRAPQHHLGHNPLGSWGIYALLVLAVLAGASGYATYALDLHAMEEAHEFLANTLLAVVVVHIAGVMVTSVLQRQNLVRAMITGYKQGEPAQGIRRRHAIVAVLVLGVLSALWIGKSELPAPVPSVHAGTSATHARDGGDGD